MSLLEYWCDFEWSGVGVLICTPCLMHGDGRSEKCGAHFDEGQALLGAR